MVIENGTFISSSVLWIRDTISSLVQDPISEQRTNRNEKFVLTAYPQRAVQYPIITIRNIGGNSRNLGMQSETQLFELRYEIRIWARNEKEKETLTEQTINALKNYQTDTLGSNANHIYGFTQNSMVNVDEPDVKSKVIEIKYIFIN